MATSVLTEHRYGQPALRSRTVIIPVPVHKHHVVCGGGDDLHLLAAPHCDLILLDGRVVRVHLAHRAGALQYGWWGLDNGWLVR